MSESERNILIDGRGVTKVFKDFWGRPRVTAVRGVDIRVTEGSIFGLLGPNGAGKSTLIKMVLGHLYPTSGALRVLGRPPVDVEAKSRLGYLPERPVFYKTLTAEEILSLFGQILGLPKQEIARRTDQLIEMVGLQGARRRPVGGFSHGMSRRLGLAQALLNDPDLLLLDEPTAGLDPIGCHEVKNLILTLAARGKTVVMSSHLLADVQNVCDEIMIMYGGRVQQTGSVADLLAQADEVQIRAPRVSDDVISSVRSQLATEADASAIHVSVPTRSLEDYFLDVVRRANEDRQETAGAQMGAGVAAYLQSDAADQALLSELSQSPSPAPEKLSEPEAGPPVDRAVLDGLTDDESPGDEQTPEGDDGESDVDQGVLDSLTRS
ncbi:MAG: ABC transporter ATP-binding protein [Lentisphaerae bacterium]|jgi:ABC-2 type transport system ATP-binding protein|nr:ABC transporter ATP-binding protein [Lentisphaerota bacterium]MBT4817466.1 ABC transporter ATP-binding protein [Lentisphaerota bacterium]MBT5612751.1 ABC transporter ATP-binding protein [Lentisphaerota bacterium]MBT7058980.1 ABC transporter ATP-binding protein [Lentisphaerota bacterium]MBT7848400.1 ABC transporter ATP-binding protein [Lentisphaerota bacterium]